MGPDTGVHIQHSEQMWGSSVRKNKMHHKKHNPKSHLCEFICRHSGKGEDPSGRVLASIKECFAPSESSIKHGN